VLTSMVTMANVAMNSVVAIVAPTQSLTMDSSVERSVHEGIGTTAQLVDGMHHLQTPDHGVPARPCPTTRVRTGSPSRRANPSAWSLRWFRGTRRWWSSRRRSPRLWPPGAPRCSSPRSTPRWRRSGWSSWCSKRACLTVSSTWWPARLIRPARRSSPTPVSTRSAAPVPGWWAPGCWTPRRGRVLSPPPADRAAGRRGESCGRSGPPV